ncbi:MAG: gamma-glutamyl hercynylcysteine S-oxide synthase [Gaiellaceae bacterium]|nr:gamma-glutamyl hercynylcysteine S-oxide synthase [Gaiellaceae bacterium]
MQQETPTKRELAAALNCAREATLRLVEPVDDEQMVAQVSPIMSPLVWDLAHIGWFEELWLIRRIAIDEPLLERFDDVYDAFRHPRGQRSRLPILTPPEARAYLESVRRRALRVLEDVPLEDSHPLLRGAYVYGLVLQHELQHQETILQTLQLSGVAYATPPHDDLQTPPGPEDVLVPAGPLTLGTNKEPWAYDNEKPARVVDLPAFWVERHPVTNGRFAEFVEDGGYRKRRYWSDDGWQWLREERVQAPLYWQRGSGGWVRQRLGRSEPVPPAEPVQHISFYEAEAVAAWAGKRLPTEAEWENAAQGADSDGDGNLGRESFGPLPVARRATSWVGCECMLGDVWEWTSSAFTGYPGFTAFPYAEYSEVFFGDEHRVLRGGSWATDPLVARRTFRNWDYPGRRQLFSGVRLAADA